MHSTLALSPHASALTFAPPVLASLPPPKSDDEIRAVVGEVNQAAKQQARGDGGAYGGDDDIVDSQVGC